MLKDPRAAGYYVLSGFYADQRNFCMICKKRRIKVISDVKIFTKVERVDISYKLIGTSVSSVNAFVASIVVNTSVSYNKIDLSQLGYFENKIHILCMQIRVKI